MSALADRPPIPVTRAATTPHRHPARARRASAVQHLGPNWFAAVMGTGIVATAAVSLPIHVPGQQLFALVVWCAAALLLLVLLAATAAHWILYPTQARAHISHPVMSHFYGAPPMAMLTVGAGALLIGRELIGLHAALIVDWTLWTAGTLGGLLTAVLVPYLAFTRHEYDERSAFGGWLMPVVPPMVSATTGAFLLPHVPAGQARETLLMACYAMFGLSLLASIVVITLIWTRLAHHKIGDAAAVPTLWIVLGPLGQSMTAAHVLGAGATTAIAAPYDTGLQVFGLLYAVVVWGFMAMWLTIAAAITIRTVRRGLPFSLTWWSFTFPVGTCVTGTSGLAAASGLPVFEWAAEALYGLLLVTWSIVLVRTLHGTIRGALLIPAGPAVPAGFKTAAAAESH